MVWKGIWLPGGEEQTLWFQAPQELLTMARPGSPGAADWMGTSICPSACLPKERDLEIIQVNRPGQSPTGRHSKDPHQLFEARLYVLTCDPSLRETRVISVKLVTSSHGCWFGSISSGKWSRVPGTIKLPLSVSTVMSTDKRPHCVCRMDVPFPRPPVSTLLPAFQVKTQIAAVAPT